MAEPDILRTSVALVGPGRAGRAFARSWLEAGGRIGAVIVRTPGAAPRLGDAPVVGADAPDFPRTDLVVIAVPDDAVASVADALAPRLPCRYAFHLSGALGSSALAPFASRGALIASVHPVRPFTGAEHEDWRGAFVAVEGGAEAVAAAGRLASALGARPYRLPAENRSLYHAAATLAAGGTAAVVSVAVRGWVAAGLPEDVARETLAALASRAADAVGRQPFAGAFTGAVARRDAGTVRSHLAALGADPEMLALYRSLAEEILRRTDGAGREEEIRSILRAPPSPAREGSLSS